MHASDRPSLVLTVKIVRFEADETLRSRRKPYIPVSAPHSRKKKNQGKMVVNKLHPEELVFFFSLAVLRNFARYPTPRCPQQTRITIEDLAETCETAV